MRDVSRSSNEAMPLLDAAAQARDRVEPPTRYLSTPRPPRRLWDKADQQFLELVKCFATIRVVSIDPKVGTFRIRMKCHWSFRTLNSQEECESALRGVPGIRMPANSVVVEESRVWKDLSRNEAKSTHKTVYWKGTSTFVIDGFKVFHMENFPFDRQVVNLEQLNFVWRPAKDDDDYFKSMKVVSFTVNTESLLPEWSAEPAYITPLHKSEIRPADPSCPSYTHQFVVLLRIERKEWFYIRQVFFVTYLMTLVSCSPLTMPPTEDSTGTRLEIYGSSMLTLVAFKYAVAEHLPSVPYSTFADDFLLAPLVCVSACVLETVAASQIVDRSNPELQDEIDTAENISFYLLFVFWTIYFCYSAFWKPRNRTPWVDVLARKSQNRWVMKSPEDIRFFEKQDSGDDLEEEGEEEELEREEASCAWTDGQSAVGNADGSPRLRISPPRGSPTSQSAIGSEDSRASQSAVGNADGSPGFHMTPPRDSRDSR